MELFVPLVFLSLAKEKAGQCAKLLQLPRPMSMAWCLPNLLEELPTGAYIGNLTFVLVSVHILYI